MMVRTEARTVVSEVTRTGTRRMTETRTGTMTMISGDEVMVRRVLSSPIGGCQSTPIVIY